MADTVRTWVYVKFKGFDIVNGLYVLDKTELVLRYVKIDVIIKELLLFYSCC